jgi:multimeric flavodoxin WrbA
LWGQAAVALEKDSARWSCANGINLAPALTSWFLEDISALCKQATSLHNSLAQRKRMKAIAINGSPRNGGNTEILLRKVLEPLTEAGWTTEFIQLGGKPIRGCRACYQCFKTKNSRCGQKDDLFDACLEKMIQADAIILGSPTYFTDVSAEMKALLDRAGLVAVANGGLFRRKIGAAVVAVRRGGGTHAFDTINHMFLMSGAIIPGSTYWNLGFGLDKGEVKKDEEGLRNMADLGQTIAWLGKAIQQSPDRIPTPVYSEPSP